MVIYSLHLVPPVTLMQGKQPSFVSLLPCTYFECRRSTVQFLTLQQKKSFHSKLYCFSIKAIYEV